MFPLPPIPYLPQLHRFLAPEQARSFAMVFGVALFVQAFLPWGKGFGLVFSAATIWPLLVGLGFCVIAFVPGVIDHLKPNLLFLIVAGSALVGAFWSFASAGGPAMGQFPAPFYGSGFGLLGLVTTLTALFLWARNGYRQATWMMLLGGLASLAIALLIPIGGGFPLARIFTQIGGGALGVIAGIVGMLLTLAFIGLLVLLVLEVFLKRDQADRLQVERFANAIFVAALLFPLVQALFGLHGIAMTLHMVLINGTFLFLSVWGLVCFSEAKARGENLLQF